MQTVCTFFFISVTEKISIHFKNRITVTFLHYWCNRK